METNRITHGKITSESEAYKNISRSELNWKFVPCWILTTRMENTKRKNKKTRPRERMQEKEWAANCSPVALCLFLVQHNKRKGVCVCICVRVTPGGTSFETSNEILDAETTIEHWSPDDFCWIFIFIWVKGQVHWVIRRQEEMIIGAAQCTVVVYF